MVSVSSKNNHHREFLDYLQNSEDLMIILSEKGIILAANTAASAYYGDEHQDLYNKNYFDILGHLGIESPFSSADLRSTGNKSRTVTTVLKYKGQIFEWTLSRFINKNCPPKTFLLIGKRVGTQLGEISGNLEEKTNPSSASQAMGKLNNTLVGEQHYAEQNEADSVRYQLESIIGCMPGNIYWLDKNGVTLGGNDNTARTFGLSSRYEFVGITYDDMAAYGGWTEGQQDSFRRDDIEVITTGIPKLNVEEPPMTDAEGKTIYFLTSRVPLRDQHGEITGVLGISIDITERKKMEQSLKEAKEKAEIANKAKTEFLENMRHDLRTPLSGIVGFSELLSKETDIKKINEYSTSLSEASKELLRFLNEILESIHVASGEIPLVKKKFNLKTTLTNVIKLHQPKAYEKQLNLLLDFDENIPPYLIGDPVRIYRIVLELFVNALKFTKEGYVRVVAKLAKKEGRHIIIQIEVEDSGPGIPTEKQQELFVRFKRLTPSYQGIYKGTGLGLSIIKQFIDDLQGEIYVDNQSKGTKIICLLPVTESLLEHPVGEETYIKLESLEPTAAVNAKLIKNEAPVNQSSDAQSQKHSILIVEDQFLAANVVKELLTKLKCEAVVAPDGQTAIQLVKQHQYDLILMDIGLPDIDGYETTQQIRIQEEKSGFRVPIIGLTAHVDAEKKQKGFYVGMNVVLSKPLTQEITAGLLKDFIPTYKINENLELNNLENGSATSTSNKAIVNFEIARKISDASYTNGILMLKSFVESFPQEDSKLNEAHVIEDWKTIEAISHKLRGACTYCGASRLEKACIDLTMYLSQGKTEIREALYQKMREEMRALKWYVECLNTAT